MSPEQRLSAQAAFVVQFVTGSDVRAGVVGGRVEHVASGRNKRFESVHELLAFLADVLAQPTQEKKD